MKYMIIAAALLSAGMATADTLRVATFNASMNRKNAGDLLADIKAGDTQIAAIAEIIQRVRPDVLLINEFDYDPAALAAFQTTTLVQPQDTQGVGGTEAITYEYSYIAPSNTGEASGYDLDGNGEVGGPGDAYGFGFFPGQYGMVVLSRFPIDVDQSRSFQKFLWKDMPDHIMPEGFYRDDAIAAFRLSSKSHWDLNIKVGDDVLHLLASHPTPPVFDGPEDRNGRRNHDEIRFWADYVKGASYIYDDAGVASGLEAGAHFVIAGDMNADPFDGDSTDNAANLLLDHPLINGDAQNASVTPASQGGAETAANQAGANLTHNGNPGFDTADFGFDRDNPGTDKAPGNLRVDYVLPSNTLTLKESGVFWPASNDPLHKLAAWPTSDHRLVWIDVDLQ